jgi:hypothetical protein
VRATCNLPSGSAATCHVVGTDHAPGKPWRLPPVHGGVELAVAPAGAVPARDHHARRSAAADWLAERSAAKGEFEVAIPIRRMVAMRARLASTPA